MTFNPNILLHNVDYHTHLGLVFCSDLSWSRHIKAMVSKASQRVNLIKGLKYLLGFTTLINLYKSIIHPVLEYANIIIDNCTKYDKKLIESVQYDAARVCTGALYNTLKVKLLGEVGWVSLFQRRKYHKLIMFFRIMTKLVPPYLCIDEIKSVSTFSSYSLRSTNKIRLIRAKSNYYKFHFTL